MKKTWRFILYILFSSFVCISGKCFSRPTANRQLPTANSQQPTVNGHRSSVNGINREAFYKAMEENNKELVNAQLDELKSAPEELRPAFLGAMLMKRASFVGSAGTKLRYFKEGHKMLESAIKQNPENTEYRFLRLMVQEHVPGVVGYKDDIQKDCEFIRKSYRSLPPEIQQFITGYNKKSKFLKLDVS